VTTALSCCGWVPLRRGLGRVRREVPLITARETGRGPRAPCVFMKQCNRGCVDWRRTRGGHQRCGAHAARGTTSAANHPAGGATITAVLPDGTLPIGESGDAQ
jgi:hypothetical protein